FHQGQFVNRGDSAVARGIDCRYNPLLSLASREGWFVSASLLNIRFLLLIMVAVVLSLRRLFGLRRGSPTWILLGVLVVALFAVRFSILWIMLTANAQSGPAINSSPNSSSASPALAPPKQNGAVHFYQDGWIAEYDDSQGVNITVTIVPPQAPQARAVLEALNGARKIRTVAFVTLHNRSPHT